MMITSNFRDYVNRARRMFTKASCEDHVFYIIAISFVSRIINRDNHIIFPFLSHVLFIPNRDQIFIYL